MYAFMRELVQESLRDWFKKEKWVRITTSGNIAGPCGTSKNKKKIDYVMSSISGIDGLIPTIKIIKYTFCNS